MRTPYLLLFLPSFLACSGELPSAPAAHPAVPVGLVASSTPACMSLQGRLADVQDGPKVLHARLTGELEGSLQFVYEGFRSLGAVEQSRTTFVLDQENGAVRFGDGEVGRVLPSGGGSAVPTYRYGAKGSIQGGTGEYAGAKGGLVIEGWIGSDAPEQQLRYVLTICPG